jgi:mRNA-degrading endonuclease RelE of RelBE toxin-antitoxin system
VRFIETSIFTRQVKSLLDDDEYRQLQNEILLNPKIGKAIPHSNGLRKMRFAQKNKGEREGLRVIYYWVIPKNSILMLMMYSKSEKEDLTSNQLKILKSTVEKELI